MKKAIKKTALQNARNDRFHVTIIVRKCDDYVTIPLLRKTFFWAKADWEIETENERFFVYRVKTRPNDIRGFFVELKMFYKKLRSLSLNFKIVGNGFWLKNGKVVTEDGIYIFEDYFADVLSQLSCNASDEYKKTCITYEYTTEEVSANKYYFEQCRENGLSAYKALLFFDDYLNREYCI